MLGSIVNQISRIEHELVPNVAFLRHNGTPTTEAVLHFFERNYGLECKWFPYDELREIDEFAKRGNVRNAQSEVLDHDTDMVLFSDSDMVYDIGFFQEAIELVTPNLGQKKVHCIGRYSNDAEVAQDLIEKYGPYPMCPTVDAYKELSKISNIKKANVGAGYFQLVEAKFLEGFYVENPNDKHLFDEGQKARSDIRFRKRFDGRIKYDRMKTRQLHINHVRDNEFGTHLEIQR